MSLFALPLTKGRCSQYNLFISTKRKSWSCSFCISFLLGYEKGHVNWCSGNLCSQRCISAAKSHFRSCCVAKLSSERASGGAKCLNIERHCFYWMPRGICPVGDLNSCCCIREISPRAILFADPADTEFSSARVFILPAWRCGGFFLLSLSLSFSKQPPAHFFCVVILLFSLKFAPRNGGVRRSFSLSFRHPRLLSYLIISEQRTPSHLAKWFYLFKFYV